MRAMRCECARGGVNACGREERSREKGGSHLVLVQLDLGCPCNAHAMHMRGSCTCVCMHTLCSYSSTSDATSARRMTLCGPAPSGVAARRHSLASSIASGYGGATLQLAGEAAAPRTCGKGW